MSSECTREVNVEIAVGRRVTMGTMHVGVGVFWWGSVVTARNRIMDDSYCKGYGYS